MTPNAKPQPQPLLRKPMARTVKVALFEREVREKLSGAAVEILLSRAQLLSEGRRSASPTANAAYFGSTMLTIDLAGCADLVRDACDGATAARVAEMMAADPRVQKRVRQIAAAEAERAGAVGARAVELRVRAEGSVVFVDVDVEGPPAA